VLVVKATHRDENSKIRDRIQRLDEALAVAVDDLVPMSAARAECERRATILLPKNDRAMRTRRYCAGD
jgi:hypothetical protein